MQIKDMLIYQKINIHIMSYISNCGPRIFGSIRSHSKVKLAFYLLDENIDF